MSIACTYAGGGVIIKNWRPSNSAPSLTGPGLFESSQQSHGQMFTRPESSTQNYIPNIADEIWYWLREMCLLILHGQLQTVEFLFIHTAAYCKPYSCTNHAILYNSWVHYPINGICNAAFPHPMSAFPARMRRHWNSVWLYIKRFK